MVWSQTDKQNWFQEQKIKRSYQKMVVNRITTLGSKFDLKTYGALTIDPALYPLYVLKSKNLDPQKKTILITGGVHGYETSGVLGALAFLETKAEYYQKFFNFICAPCMSPWAFETINRWNPQAIDPNRSFFPESPAEESRFFVEMIASEKIKPFAHFDLHETTDSDNTVFRPALEKRDGVTHKFSEIPDGFYLVGDAQNPQPDFQKAIIESVRKVTHIAPADQDGQIIGRPLEQEGVINYELKKLFLCAGVTEALYTTTTEVYPDSPKVTDEICIAAQVAAITGGLDYLLNT